MVQEIFIIEDKKDIINHLNTYFNGSANIIIRQITSSKLARHLLDVPSLFFINEDALIDNNVVDICKLIRDYSTYLKCFFRK